MITTPIFTRLLSTSEYGQYSVFYSWLSIITPIICLNLSSGVYAQGIVKFEYDREKYTSSLQGLVFTLVSIWTGIYILSKDFWTQLFGLTEIQMLCMLFIIWSETTFNFWSISQRTDFKYRKLVALTLLSSVLQPALCIWFILQSNDKVTARILGITFVHLILYSWVFFYQLHKGRLFCSHKYWRYALKFNIPLLPHYLSMTVLSSSDRIMISRMVGDDKAGIYNLAYSVSMIMTMFNSALLQTIEPWVYRKLKDNRVQDLSHVAYPCFLLIAAVNILLIIFAPEVIMIFAPEQYREAIWCIPAVTLSVFFTFLYTFFATFEFYYEKTSYIAFATVGGAVLNIVLNYIFIDLFGYVAAAYTTLFSYILFALLHYHFMRKICRDYLDDIRPYEPKLIIGIGCLSLLIGFGFMATYNYPLLRYFIIVICFLVALTKKQVIVNMITTLVNIRKGNE